MKVPVYRSQTGLPERTGAGQLSVQASPSALGAPGAAQVGFGQTVEQEGLRWTEHFQKTDHALSLTEASKTMRGDIQVITDLANQEPVEFWKDKYGKQAGYHLKDRAVRAQLDRAMRNGLRAIKNPTVRLSMTPHWLTAITNARASIGATLRGRYAPFVKGKLITHGNDKTKEIALLPDGQAKDKAIDDAIKEARGFFELFTSIGDDYWAKYVQNFNADIAEMAVRSSVGLITRSDGPTGAVEMLRQLRTPKIGDPHYKDITKRMNPMNRQRLIDSVSKLTTRLQLQEFNGEIRARNQTHIDKGRKEKALFEKYDRDIAMIREAAVLGKDINLKMPTVMEINDLDINKIQRDSLLQQLYGGKEIYNPPLVAKLRTQILEAVTEHDLEMIREDIHQYRTANIIGGLAFKNLTETLRGASGKTPEHLEIKRYHDAIKRIMKPKNIIVVGGGYAPEQAKSQAATMAAGVSMQNYQLEIAAGVMPAKAFYNTIEKFYEDRDLMVQNQIKTVPSRFLPLKVIRNHKLLTPEDIENAMQGLRDEAKGLAPDAGRLIRDAGRDLLEMSQEERGMLQREGRLDKSKRMSIRLLLEYEAKLEYLRDYADIEADARNISSTFGGPYEGLFPDAAPDDGGGGVPERSVIQKLMDRLK